MSEPDQVVIVGAGPAGCAAAITLARAGHPTLLLDRAEFPRDKTCGDALSNEAVRLLGELGALPAILAGPHAEVHKARALLPDGSEIDREYEPPGLIVPRLVLDDAIRLAAESEGVELRQGTAVRSLTRDADRVVAAEVDGGAAVRGRFFIAADGSGSVARAVLGHAPPQGKLLGVARTAYLEGVRFDDGPDVSDHYFEDWLPCGYGWVFPAVDGRTNVGVYQRSDQYEGGRGKLDAALNQFLDLHPERFADAKAAGPRRSWPLPIGPAPWELHAPGLLAVGDAGNHIDPLSGEGIWQALRSGMLAAQALLYAGEDGAGRSYAAACRREIGRMHRRRVFIQEGMRTLIDSGLYRLPPIQWALRWGYRRQHFEGTKSL